MLKEKLKKNYNGVADCSAEFPFFTQFGTFRFAEGAEKDGQVSLFTQFGTFWLARGAERDGSSLAFSNRR